VPPVDRKAGLLQVSDFPERLEQAAAEFRVATVDPRNVESLVNLALVQKAAGPAEARDLLLRALAIDPRHPGSHY
jgi:Tfp pilus assembly protein PilF